MPMARPTLTNDLLDLLRKCGLEDAVRRFTASGPLPDAPRPLADALVRDGVLTRFQAEQLLQGEWRNLVIAGKYLLRDKPARGSMGTVLLCDQPRLRRLVALKALSASQAGDPAVRERFERQGQAAAALDHPNLVKVHGVEHDGKQHFLVMEVVVGRPLGEVVRKDGPLDPARAARCVRLAALGLQHAHAAGLVHGAVSPDNLLVDRAGKVKVLDVGTAPFFREAADDPAGANYVAPEQASNAPDVDARADVYSLGLTLYFLLTGRAPFPDGTAAQKLVWHQLRQPKPVREVRPEVPAGLAAVLDKMTAKDREHRYRTAAGAADALAPWTGERAEPPAEAAPKRDGAIRVRLVEPAPAPPAVKARPAKADDTPPPAKKTVRVREVEPPPARAGGGWIAAVLVIVALGLLLLAGTAVVAAWWLLGGAGTPVAQQPPPPDPSGFRSPGRPAGRGGFQGHQAGVDRIALSPDGRLLVSGALDRTVRIWDVATGQELRRMDHPDTVHHVAFAPDGRTVASACMDRVARVWDVTTGQEVRQFVGHQARVWGVVFTPDGRSLCTASDDRTARVWDVTTGQELRRFEGYGDTVNSVAVSPDGRLLLVTSWDRTARTYDLGTGAEVRRVNPGWRPATGKFSPDGRLFLTGDGDGSCTLWDTGSGRLVRKFDARGDGPWMVVFTPDGKRALSGGGERLVCLWEVDTGRLVQTFEGHTAGVTGLVVLPDGKSFISSSRDSTIRVWDLP
jgi:hypothetical protein